MTGIIILNWNGWQDTIDCIESLMKTEDSPFFVIIVDNGSSNDSISQLRNQLPIKTPSHFHYLESQNSHLPESVESKDIILLNAGNNYGFAKGNNIGLKIAKNYSADYYMLLNNDTVVEPGFLKILVEFIVANPKYSVLTPRIVYFFNPNLVWNCGGCLKWGFRKYFYGNRELSRIREREYIDIEYITGCALFFKSYLIDERNLLTEKFFHGEEDIEFSYRMKKNGVKIACVLTSHILHKVGVSLKNKSSIGKIYVHYLNRFIDIRNQLSKPSYFIWKIVYYPYISYLLHRLGFDLKTICHFIAKLDRESEVLDGVTKDKFLSLITKGIKE